MKAFAYIRPQSAEAAAAALADNDGALIKANGIDLLDRMKERVDEPNALVGLVDVEAFDSIEVEEDGGIRIGAGATLAQLAASQVVERFLPSLAYAAGHAASPQLRTRATVGGNLGQHTRCGYYRHKSFPCLKRGGDHCPVLKPGGVQDTAAIFGNGTCASASPSSLAPVFGSLDAVLTVRRGEATREVPFAEAWAEPKAGWASDLVFDREDLIESVHIPARAEPQRLGYEEVRQKAAFDWPLTACGVRLVAEGNTVKEARVWLGSVAPTPLRSEAAEKVLVGKSFTEARARAAGEAAVTGASPLPGNTYKVQLTKVVVRRALMQAWGRS
ncbi:MAG: FAD binding domain-containing protein [Planctomycetota bacterium]|nr:FAD binding domain-containing protein [Planctomycetota bacterium]